MWIWASRRLPLPPQAMNPKTALMMRKPTRVSITVSQSVLDRLLVLSTEQGRSTSNLAAYLLETALDALEKAPEQSKRWPRSTA